MKCCQVNVKCQTHSASSTGPPHESLIRGLGHPHGLRWCTFIRRLHLLFNHAEANVADVMRTVLTLNSFRSICLPLSGVCSLGSNSRQWKHTSTVQLFFINLSEILLLLVKKWKRNTESDSFYSICVSDCCKQTMPGTELCDWKMKQELFGQFEPVVNWDAIVKDVLFCENWNLLGNMTGHRWWISSVGRLTESHDDFDTNQESKPKLLKLNSRRYCR